MSKNKVKIISLLLAIILMLSSTFVFADNEEVQNSVQTETEQSANNQALNSKQDAASQKADQEGTSNGQAEGEDSSYKKEDVYLKGDNVTVDYIVDGNLFVIGNTVTINSQIGGDAFVIAKNVIVGEKGYIFNNLFVLSESVDVKGVIFDVYGVTKNFTISGGYIYRDLKLASENLNINGTIGRDAFVNCGNIKFNTDENKRGIINGNLNYTSKSEINFESGLINGKTTFTQSKVKSTSTIIKTYIFTICSFVALASIVWLLLLWLAPKFLKNADKFVGKKTWSILGIGLLTFLAIPLACIILVALRITVQVSLVLFAIYMVMLAISSSIFAIVTNNYLCNKLKIKKDIAVFGMLVVTSVIIGVVANLPYVGPIISCIIAILGLGTLVSSILPKKEEKVVEIKK